MVLDPQLRSVCVNDVEDPKLDDVVQDTPATTTEAPAEAPKDKVKKTCWWYRLLGRKKLSLSELNIANYYILLYILALTKMLQSFVFVFTVFMFSYPTEE